LSDTSTTFGSVRKYVTSHSSYFPAETQNI
jgi:hypothetical protein